MKNSLTYQEFIEICAIIVNNLDPTYTQVKNYYESISEPVIGEI